MSDRAVGYVGPGPSPADNERPEFMFVVKDGGCVLPLVPADDLAPHDEQRAFVGENGAPLLRQANLPGRRSDVQRGSVPDQNGQSDQVDAVLRFFKDSFRQGMTELGPLDIASLDDDGAQSARLPQSQL